MALTNDIIRERLIEKFGDQIGKWEEPYGMLTFSTPKELNLKVLQFLFDDPQLQFRFMTDLTAVHYPDDTGHELAVVYHMHNLADNVRIRYKCLLMYLIRMFLVHLRSTLRPIGWKEKRMTFMGSILWVIPI